MKFRRDFPLRYWTFYAFGISIDAPAHAAAEITISFLRWHCKIRRQMNRTHLVRYTETDSPAGRFESNGKYEACVISCHV